jgi:hypothetical protein
MLEFPAYVSVVFILTTFATIAFLLQAARAAGLQRLPSRILIFLLAVWIFFQAALAASGFYINTSVLPPRPLIFGVLPTLLLIAAYFLFFRRSFIEKLPLSLLTLLHVVRIPVELVLAWLAAAGTVPEIMTFHGRNFDIVSGILAPIVYYFAGREGRVNRTVLIAYNILGLLLLANIVTIAVLSLQTPFQQFGLDQPNRAVLHLPYIWLPTIVVPAVLFAHLATLWQIFFCKPTLSKA